MHTFDYGYSATFINTLGRWYGLIYKDGVYIMESLYSSTDRDAVVNHVTAVIENTIFYQYATV